MAKESEENVDAREAFATMVTSDSYVVGAVVLASSLQSASARRPVVCMVSPQVSAESRKVLRGAGMELADVEGGNPTCLCGRSAMFVLVVPRLFASAACADIAAPRTSDVEAWNQSGYTKLNLWRLVRYSKLVYVDADCLVVERSPAHLSPRHIRAGVVGRFASSPPQPTLPLSLSTFRPALPVRSMDDLFARETDFAAAPDTFPPDRFNAGVLVLRPSLEVFQDMMAKMEATNSYDGGDTGFLNAYFNDWYSSGPGLFCCSMSPPCVCVCVCVSVLLSRSPSLSHNKRINK